MTVLLREVTDNDMELILAWRSSPLVYQSLYSQRGPLTWEEHYKWWKSRYNWKRWIIQVNDNETTRDVGCVNFGQLDSWKPQVGIFIGEVTLWGKGIAKEALTLALEWLREQSYIRIWTTILKDNFRSIKLFEGLGFKKIGEGRPGEWEYELRLKEENLDGE